MIANPKVRIEIHGQELLKEYRILAHIYNEHEENRRREQSLIRLLLYELLRVPDLTLVITMLIRRLYNEQYRYLISSYLCSNAKRSLLNPAHRDYVKRYHWSLTFQERVSYINECDVIKQCLGTEIKSTIVLLSARLDVDSIKKRDIFLLVSLFLLFSLVHLDITVYQRDHHLTDKIAYFLTERAHGTVIQRQREKFYVTQGRSIKVIDTLGSVYKEKQLKPEEPPSWCVLQ